MPTLIISGSVLTMFVILSFINADMVANTVDYLFGLSVTYFGTLYQLVLLGTFLIAIVLGFSKFGHIRLGNVDKPEMSTIKWISKGIQILSTFNVVLAVTLMIVFYYLDQECLFSIIDLNHLDYM